MSKEQQAAAEVKFPDLTYVITWLEGDCDPLAAAKELRAYQKQVGGELPPEPQPKAVAAVQAQGDAANFCALIDELIKSWWHTGNGDGKEQRRIDAREALEKAIAALQPAPMPAQANTPSSVPDDDLMNKARAIVPRLYNDTPSTKTDVEAGEIIQWFITYGINARALQSTPVSDKVAVSHGDLSKPGLDLEGVPQPFAGAIVLLETIAECGAQAFYDGGQPTPNRELCLRFAKELRAAALSQPPAVEAPKGRWKWMPREATSEMVSAGDDWTEPQNVWRAMFDKAPTISGSTLEAAHRLIEAALPEDEPDCVPDWVCELLINLGMQQAQSVTAVEAPSDIKPYYAGLLNGFGGGNVDWWHDYIRAQLEWAHEFYLSQIAALPAPLPKAEAASDPTLAAMNAVAIEYAHSLALNLECIIADDYSGTWYTPALEVVGKYRSAMAEIHEKESPTRMGEPVINKRENILAKACREDYDNRYHKVRADLGYDAYQRIWNAACRAALAPSAVQPAETLTAQEIEDTMTAIRSGMNPGAGMFFPRGWNVILDKLQAMLAQPAQGTQAVPDSQAMQISALKTLWQFQAVKACEKVEVGAMHYNDGRPSDYKQGIMKGVQDCIAAIKSIPNSSTAAPKPPEPCTTPEDCEQQGCRNPMGRCEEAAPKPPAVRDGGNKP